jgi:hypothetical protein
MGMDAAAMDAAAMDAAAMDAAAMDAAAMDATSMDAAAMDAHHTDAQAHDAQTHDAQPADSGSGGMDAATAADAAEMTDALPGDAGATDGSDAPTLIVHNGTTGGCSSVRVDHAPGHGVALFMIALVLLRKDFRTRRR